MAQNWKKEAARRGYWYRKTKKVVLLHSIEIISLKHFVQLYRNYLQLYCESFDENNKLQRNRDAFRDKYLDYIRKFNTVKSEKEKIEQERDSIRWENDAIKQEKTAIKQVLKTYKRDNINLRQDNIKMKQEIIDIKQDNEGLAKMIEPITKRMNKLWKKYRNVKQENKEFLYLLEPTLDTNILTSDDEIIPVASDDEHIDLQEPRDSTNIPTRNNEELDEGTTTITEKTPNIESFPKTVIEKTTQVNVATFDESSIKVFKRKKRMKKSKNTKKRKF